MILYLNIFFLFDMKCEKKIWIDKNLKLHSKYHLLFRTIMEIRYLNTPFIVPGIKPRSKKK